MLELDISTKLNRLNPSMLMIFTLSLGTSKNPGNLLGKENSKNKLKILKLLKIK
jgi:hypothetical protein